MTTLANGITPQIDDISFFWLWPKTNTAVHRVLFNDLSGSALWAVDGNVYNSLTRTDVVRGWLRP